MVVFLIIFSATVGAAFGSFACCQAWRIYYEHKKKKILGKRSVCLKCGKTLDWFENIPIFSWVFLRGKCRKCGAPIGKMEIVVEILGAILGGVLGYKIWGEFSWFEAIGWLLIVVIFVLMAIVAIYDAKWGEMPTRLLWLIVGFSILFAGVKICQKSLVEKEYDCCPAEAQCIVGTCKGKTLDFDSLKTELIDLSGSILLLAGVYYVLYKISKEKWVGGGDWILCLSVALVLGKPFLALIELSLANILGLIVMLPQKNRKKMIPFGPFLVVACIAIFCLC